MTQYFYYIFAMPLVIVLSGKFLGIRKKYFWYEYLAMLFLPLILLYVLSLSAGSQVLLVFLVFCFVGPLIEALGGYAMIYITGRHLWIYEKYPLFNRTTSVIVIPMWGLAGTMFYAVDKLVETLFR